MSSAPPFLDRRSRLRRGREAAHTRRRRGLGLALFVLLAAGGFVGVLILLSDDGGTRTPVRYSAPGEAAASRLLAIAVRTGGGGLAAVVASGGDGEPAIVALQPETVITIPGHGDGNFGRAAGLPGASFATAVSNALGTWIEHYAVLDLEGLATVLDRAGGVSVEGRVRTGAEVAGMLEKARGAERLFRWREVLPALVSTAAGLQSWDLAETDDAASAKSILRAARGADIIGLPLDAAAGAMPQPDDFAVNELMRERFSIDVSEPIPVAVLNGSGAPGVGETVAARLIPAGFQVVESGNSAEFGHQSTQIVPSGEVMVAVARRVAEVLGVGTVTVSGVPSGVADITIVVGEDFRPE